MLDFQLPVAPTTVNTAASFPSCILFLSLYLLLKTTLERGVRDDGMNLSHTCQHTHNEHVWQH